MEKSSLGKSLPRGDETEKALEEAREEKKQFQSEIKARVQSERGGRRKKFETLANDAMDWGRQLESDERNGRRSGR